MSDFFHTQLAAWPLAARNVTALDHVEQRQLTLSGCPCHVTLQFNPARIRSTVAKVDAHSLSERPCFLCAAHRPAEQQVLDFYGYDLLVNPYPILAEHYTIASREHRPQTLTPSVVADMQAMARTLGSEFIVFYNGPHCGASAPDHAHLQAGRSAGIPLIDYVRQLMLPTGTHTLAPLGFNIHVGVDTVPPIETDDLNVVVLVNERQQTLYLFIPRARHRPACYYSTDEAQRMVSPGALDMCGLVITPRHSDYEQLTPAEVKAILQECGQAAPEPVISVGITPASEADITLHADGFSLQAVTIGKQFHWEQQEEQRFQGVLRLVPDGDIRWAVNDIPLEQYLTSVVSSEMNAHAPIEFLKAHAIASRSWLLAQLTRKQRQPSTADMHETRQGDTLIRYYDRADHTLFDVCADDHCQRYQGTRRITPTAAHAVADTRGLVLACQGEVVDARFSKCCGGRTERYATCWDDAPHPELASVADPYCYDAHPALLATVLNGYDTATTDYYRWTVAYTQPELADLVARKSGIDFGAIVSLTPISRGPSGRISQLRIEGTRRSLTVGKELEIRRLLSPTHLYSSAFDVEAEGTCKVSAGNTTGEPYTVPARFILHGSGWGHGVGLCQIGAAVMATKGADASAILNHYFPQACIEKLY